MNAADDAFGILSDIHRAPDRTTLFARFSAQIARLDGSDFVICSFPSADGVTVAHNTSGFDEWIVQFTERGFALDCPMNVHTVTGVRPTTYEAAQSRAADTDRARESVNVAREAGIRHGLLVPVLRANGGKAGVGITTASALDNPRAWALYAASLAFHARFEDLLGHSATAGATLSPREREILLWFAHGKQGDDVADILGLTTATVMFHYRQAQMKLGTLNRTHTVVEAFRLGLLGPL